MKKFLFFTVLIFAAMQVTGANVDLATAKATAQQYAVSKMTKGQLVAPSSVDVKLVKQEMNSEQPGTAVYYIFNTNDHFIIISGDDRARTVLAYGDHPIGDINRMPANMKYWLGIYKQELEYLQAHPELQADQSINAGNPRGVSVEPLLTAMWNQLEPYYNHCPVYNGQLCVTGCPATSLAMVFYYWKFPVGPVPAVSGYNNYSYGFQVEALPGTTFDWENMIDDYTQGYTEAQADAVAWLMRYIGQEEEMDYTPTGSGAYGSDILRAVKFFGYNQETAALHYKYSYNNNTWAAMIQEELINNRPIVYSGYDSYAGGHAFNVDGYDATDDTYHINWGWSGDYNCYCALNAFSDGEYYTFTNDQQMVIGIQPPYLGPTITTSAMNMAIESYAEKTATQVLSVFGYYLDHDVTVTLNDPNGVYSIDVNHIALSEVENGKDITITYAPQEVGTHNATITLSSENAEDVVVNIVGTSLFEKHDPEMLEAIEDFIKLTEFRADWTDETPNKNVESYTLEVATKAITALLGETDWSDCHYQSSSVISHWQDYFPEGWEYQGNQLFTGNGCIQLGSGGAIISPEYDLTGYDNVTVKMRAQGYNSWYNSGVTISTSLQSVHVDLALQYTDYVFVLDCTDLERITIRGDYYPNNYGQIESIQIYAGDASEPTKLRDVNEEGDATYRLISGITPDKFYTVKNLTAGGTFFFRVKAHYTDDTWSAWSKAKTVTLSDSGIILGDVDDNGTVGMDDLTALINYLVFNDATGINMANADADTDGTVGMDDLTALINYLVFNQWP